MTIPIDAQMNADRRTAREIRDQLIERVREAALIANWDDSRCTESQVSRWPYEALRTVEYLLDEIEVTHD